MALSHYQQTLPVWQSRVLLTAGLAALAAAALGSGAYAFQSASASQELWGIPTDAVIKTTLAVAADIGVALGSAVTVWLWRSGRKGFQKQAYVAAVATAWAFILGVGNLSGYSAWTREQHAVDAVLANPLYQVAAANAERAAADPAHFYVTGQDRRLLLAAQAPVTATRDFGDVSKAIGLHALVLVFGFAYRLPAAKKTPKKKAARVQKGKPKLVVSN